MIGSSHGPTATHRCEAGSGSGQRRSATHFTSAGPGTKRASMTRDLPSGPKRWSSPMTSLARLGTISRQCPIRSPSRPGSMEDPFPIAEMAQATLRQSPVEQPPGPRDPRSPLTICPGSAVPHQISIAPQPGPGHTVRDLQWDTAPPRLTEVA